jgi:hypothetical protein
MKPAVRSALLEAAKIPAILRVNDSLKEQARLFEFVEKYGQGRNWTQKLKSLGVDVYL